MSVDELNETSEQIAARKPDAARMTTPSTDALVSGAVGTAEGVTHRVYGIVGQAVEDARGFRLGTESLSSLASKVGRAERRAESYLALAGVVSPPNAQELEQTIELVVARARANKTRLSNGEKLLDFPKLDHFATASGALLGLNTGDDRIEEVRVIDHTPRGRKRRRIEIHAFDHRGFHVLDANLSRLDAGVLYVDALRATHGRNCEDLELDFGGHGVPGRGNALAVAAGLESLITEAVKNGVHTLATSPGSPAVASLYMKMGFTEPGSEQPFSKRRLEWLLEQFPLLSEGVQAANLIRKQQHVEEQLERGEEPNWIQKLDLTNPEAVHQALAGFRLSRAAITDVPKDVAAKLEAAGEKEPEPRHTVWKRKLPESKSNVRVLRLSE
jgi:hypothetical protein